jgi:hypothetical protein
MISGTTPGRADKVPTRVRSGSFVIPADCVAALGEGNSESGAEILSRMFHTGPADDGDESGPVPVRLSHGEYVLSPGDVREVGHGSHAAGIKVLHKFVLRVRREHIATLRGLKGPKA